MLPRQDLRQTNCAEIASINLQVSARFCADKSFKQKQKLAEETAVDNLTW